MSSSFRFESSAKALERWFHDHRRVLPWRETPTPYRVWVSEIMLQQTQVATVLPYFERFMNRFPDVFALAHAPVEEVLQHWSGLGYYSRARSLWKAARLIALDRAGEFPKSADALEELPGVGPYTAGAIASIALGQAAPIVDGNVMRVLARVFAWEPILETAESKQFFWSHARKWVEAADSPSAFNQGLMELGALICRPQKPACAICPIRSYCLVAKKDLDPEAFPKRQPRRAQVELTWIVPVFEWKGKWLVRRQASGEWWADLWTFPFFPVGSHQETSPYAEKASPFCRTYPELAPKVRHTVTHHRITCLPVWCRLRTEASWLRVVRAWDLQCENLKNTEWLDSGLSATHLPLSGLTKKIVKSLEMHLGQRSAPNLLC